MAGWTTDIIIDPGTFGSSKACHILVDMMNKNVISIYEKHRVLAFITNATLHFKEIATIKNKSVREATTNILETHFKNEANKFNYPLKFKTFLDNVLHHLSRKYL